MAHPADTYLQRRATFSFERPERYNFVRDTFAKWTKEQPEAVALFWTDENATEESRTYRQLLQDANHAAGVLRDAGVEKGDCVLVILSREFRWWEIILGCMQLGAIVSPGTVQLKVKDISYRLEVANAKAIITNSDCAKNVDEGAKAIKWPGAKLLLGENQQDGWDNYEERRASVSPIKEVADTTASDPALCYFTSGTTGNPKLTVHRHDYPLGHKATGTYWLELGPDKLVWNLSDTGWAKAAWSSLFAPWIVGAGVFAFHGGAFDLEKTLDWLAKYPIATMCAPPTVYRLMVRHGMKDIKFNALLRCVSAGEPLNPEVIDIWRRDTGMEIFEGYGQTETVLLCGNFNGMDIKAGSMGLPAPGIYLDVIDHEGTLVPAGQEGDIAVSVKAGEKPQGMFTEYKDDAERTSSVHKGDWYLTGDRALRDEDGYFWFVGRADDVILSSGYRIGPFEVESVLFEHEAVAESAVVASPDPTRGEVVKAFIVLAKEAQPSEALKKELQNYVKQVTAPYKYPRKIEFVDSLPKTISGKIKRKELKEKEWAKG